MAERGYSYHTAHTLIEEDVLCARWCLATGAAVQGMGLEVGMTHREERLLKGWLV